MLRLFDYWKTAPHNFAGLEKTDYDSARFVVIPVPFDATSSYRSGARFGPSAIIDASRNMELFDVELGEIYKSGIFTLDELEPVHGSVDKTLERIEFVVSKVLADKKIPVTIGGDHSVTIGALRPFKDISVLQLDAHADLRDSYEDCRNSHACVMRRALERSEIVQVGIRSFDKEEWDLVQEKELKCFTRENIDLDKIVDSVKGKDLYVTIDMDVLDPSVMPGTGTPEPDGLSYSELVGILDKVSKETNIVGFDCVEVMPLPGSVVSEFTAAKLIYKMIGLVAREK